MRIERLRSHVLLSWIVGALLSYGMFGAAATFGYTGLTFSNVAVPMRNLSVAVLPTLAALLFAYFRGYLKGVRLTTDQRRILLVVSYIYVGLFMCLTAAMLFVPGFGLDQAAIGDRPAVNRYAILAHAQPVVAAALFYLFGKGSRE